MSELEASGGWFVDASFSCPSSPTGPFPPQVLIYNLTVKTGDDVEQRQTKKVLEKVTHYNYAPGTEV